MHITGSSTVTTVNYTDWRTITGPRTHPVTVLITEAVLVCTCNSISYMQDIISWSYSRVPNHEYTNQCFIYIDIFDRGGGVHTKVGVVYYAGWGHI